MEFWKSEADPETKKNAEWVYQKWDQPSRIFMNSSMIPR